MASDILKVFVLLLAVSFCQSDELDTVELSQFEAAFQGRCGRASPCAELCRELHDGTYECGCRPGHILHVDGYSCQEINGTSKSNSDNYGDTEEDVLYQKDASFSAELDIALVPAKDSENATLIPTTTDQRPDQGYATTIPPATTTKRSLSDDYDELNEIVDKYHYKSKTLEENSRLHTKVESNSVYFNHDTVTKDNLKRDNKGTPLYNRNATENNREIHGIILPIQSTEKSIKYNSDSYSNDNVLLSPVVESLTESKAAQDHYQYKLFKEIEGLNSLKAEGLTSKDIDMIASAALDGAENRRPSNDDDDKTLVTTLGPSLEQKVPPMSTHGPSHTESAPRSGCPLRRVGANCDKAAPLIAVPRFSGNSWLSLPPLRGAYKRVRLRVEFKPSTKDGVLLLTGERADMAGDYLALVLYRGFVELIFDCGSGPGVVRSDGEVMLNQWNTLTLYRRRWDAWLQLNGGKHVQGRSKGLFSRMTFLGPVFVGGSGNTSGLNRLPVQGGMLGCVRKLDINGRVYSLAAKPSGDALDGYDVGECGATGCSGGCLHGGRCLKKCLCPLGYAGDFCETLLDLQVPRFNGSSFLRYHGLGDSALSWLEIQVTLKASVSSGLVMFNAHRSDGVGDYFALYLKEGHAHFAFDLGTGQTVIKNDVKLTLNLWYTITVSRTGRLAVLGVLPHQASSLPDAIIDQQDKNINAHYDLQDDHDNAHYSQGLSAGAFTQLSLSQDLYLGGVPQFRIIQKKIDVNESFSGCIQRVVINDHEQSIVSSALGGVNIDGCPHACSPGVCGEGFCKPRLHHYTCICSPGVKNEKCTVYLNETSETHTDHPTTRSHRLGEFERVQYISFTAKNSTAFRNTLQAKKGPRALFNSHNSKVMASRKNNNQEKNKQVKNSEKFLIWKSVDEPKPQISEYADRDSDNEKEWILSDKNEDGIRIDSHGMKISSDQQNDDYDDDATKMVQEGSRWIFKTDSKRSFKGELNNEIIEIPKFLGHDSYIRNSDPEILKRLSSHSVDINMRFRCSKSHGLLLWLGKDGMAPGDTFMALGVEDGLLTLRYDVGSGEVIITTNQTRVDDGLWHRARAARKGQSGVLDIDGLGATGKASPGRIRPLNTDSGLYIGGMPSVWPETLGRYSAGIEGCISKLTLDREFQVPISLISHTYSYSRNVDKCPP